MRRENWTVGAEGVRPAGKPDECFYCHENVGAQHATNCVIRRRTVVLRVTLEIVTAEPEYWTGETIDFHKNESSWCSSNIMRDIERMMNAPGHDGCHCHDGALKIEYLREATVNDEHTSGLTVESLPS